MLFLDAAILFLIFPQIAISVSINNGVYSRILVGLNSTLPDTECEKLVRSVENMFKAASGVLNVATSGLTFGSVFVIVPDTWATCGSYSIGSADGYMTWDTSTIRVGGVHPLFGNEPWTQQPRGCGMKGDFISVSSRWLLSSGYSDEERGSRLVHEWAKYRWGVFEEYGHYGDPIFPESLRQGAGSWFPNYCTDNALNGGFTSDCAQSSDCNFIINNSSNVTSSLMAVPELDRVTKFCDRSNHRADLPSKHNLLCNRTSSWDIIKQHPDFTESRINNLKGAAAKTVAIKVLRENFEYSLVITYETSKVMNDVVNRFNFEKESIAQFIMYEAPSIAKVGLVSFANVPIKKTADLFTLKDIGNRKLLAKEVIETKSSLKNMTVNLQTALQLAVELSAGNGIILLVTKCTEEDPKFSAEELALTSDGHTVWVLLYPTTTTTYLSVFSDLASLTGGKVITVEDELIPDGSGVYSNPTVSLKLSQSFRQLLHLEPMFDIQQADYETCEEEESPCKRTMTLTKEFDQNMILYLYHDRADIIDEGVSSVVVSDGTCKFSGYGTFQGSVKTSKALLCTVNRKTGVTTTFDVTIFRQRSNAVLIMELVGHPVFNNSNFDIRIFFSTKIYDLRYTNDSAPAIYVQLSYSGTRVVYANVSAVITFDSASKMTYERIYLRDDGTSADVTGNDGIYSAYLVPAIPIGDFSLAMYADDNRGKARLSPTYYDSAYSSTPYKCCGSILLLPQVLEPTPPFSLSQPSISATITESPPQLNLPPGTIKDLTAVQGDSNILTLTFTATGEDLDYGTADHYIVKYFLGDENEGVELKPTYIPSPSGKTESITNGPVPCSTEYTVSVYAVDGAGLRGEDSNKINIYLLCISEKNLSAGAITGIVIACILLIIIIVIAIYLVCKKKYPDDGKGKPLKLKCSCCEGKNEERNYYNSSTTSPNLRDIERSPAQHITTTGDLILNLSKENIQTSNVYSYSNSGNSLDQVDRNDVWDQTAISASPAEGYETDSFQYSDNIRGYNSDKSLNSLKPISSFISQHSINEIGIPLDTTPSPSSTYSERKTIPIDNRSLDSFTLQLPQLPPKTKTLYNTQV